MPCPAQMARGTEEWFRLRRKGLFGREKKEDEVNQTKLREKTGKEKWGSDEIVF